MYDHKNGFIILLFWEPLHFLILCTLRYYQNQLAATKIFKNSLNQCPDDQFLKHVDNMAIANNKMVKLQEEGIKGVDYLEMIDNNF